MVKSSIVKSQEAVDRGGSFVEPEAIDSSRAESRFLTFRCHDSAGPSYEISVGIRQRVGW